MSDPLLERLERFAPDVPPSTTTPSEIRGRGDRLRRRTRAVRGAVTLVVVAAVGVPVLGLTGLADRTPAPAGPGPTVVTESPDQTPRPTDPSDPSDLPDRSERPGRGDIPAAFPLAAGFPTTSELAEDAISGPGPAVAAPTLTACGATAPAARAPTGDLRARFDDVEDYRARQVVTFADAGAAVAWVGALRGFFEGCPTESGGVEDFERLVVDRALGGQSFAVARFSLQDGRPSPGLEAVLVVRVGRAVLIDSRTSEGGLGPESQQDQAASAVETQSRDSGDVVSAMCAFTEAGC